MKILIDCSNLRVGGGIQVAISFISDLVKIRVDDEIVIFMSPEIKSSLKKISLPQNFSLLELSNEVYSNFFFRVIKLGKLERKIEPDVVFTVFGPSYHKSYCPKVVGFAIPYIVYNSSPFFWKLSVIKKIRYKILAKTKLFFF